MESLGTLASGIGHDLNNVLTPLLVSIQVLKGKLADADGQKLLDALEVNVQRGASLVKQVLAFGHGVEGERAMVQPKYIGRDIKQIVQETFPKSVEFELHVAPDLWNVIGDPDPDPSGPAESLCQCPRRHAQRRQTDPPHGEYDLR